MYDKHRNQKVMFQAIIDNSSGIEYNTAKKRDAFVKLVEKGTSHKVTCISNVSYPWNAQAGIHNLTSPEQFSSISGISTVRVYRAIKNGFLETERLGDEQYIVSNHGTYKIKGIYCNIEER